MQSGSGTKNPPWARSNVNTNMTGMNPQIMDPNSMMSQQGVMPFQQTQMFNTGMMQAQGGMGMPMGGQMPMNQMAQGQMYPGNVVAYPTPRAMNPGVYQNTQSNQSQPSSEQRVFTGTVTKTHNDFGFVDHDVFYQTSVCAKGIIPKVNDRVLVEANYNPNMPFKWNATRVQVLPKQGGPNQKNQNKSNYNAVPPPSNANKKQNIQPRRDDRPARLDRMNRDDRDNHVRMPMKRSRTRSRSRSRDRRDSRNRRDSPPRKRPVIHQPSPVKYVVRVPRMPLDIQKLDVPALSHRYTNLYIPSDFFNAHVKWGETFPPQMPFALNNPCAYHIMSKEVENPLPNDAVLEPADADYRFSAKVMLMSMPTLESLYQKCGLTKGDEKDKEKDRRSSKPPLHPTRLIKFLVGQKGKGGENFAIGGPWSTSLDGENPDTDPSVLVKTAIRTCKALTGIDLSSCTQWYRMVEFYYWREGSGGKSRLETVVLFLPDVWSAQPSRVEWTTIQEQYKAACEAALRKLEGADSEQDSSADAPPAAEQEAPPPPTITADSTSDKSQIGNADVTDTTITLDDNDEDEDKPEPTHYSKLDLRTIKVDQLRQELRARNVSCKGLRAQLISRLSKILKQEEESENKEQEVMEVEDDDDCKEVPVEKSEETADKAEADKDQEKKEEPNDDKKEEKDDKKEENVDKKEEKVDKKEEKEDKVKKDDVKDEKKEEKKDEKKEEKKEEKREKTEKEKEEDAKRLEKEKSNLRIRYELPSTPHIIVHPNATAKGGKFNCNVATLSLLLDYRVTDNKEHSFELFVFAELFNEMLMRDFGFYIYKTLYTLPEKAEEVKEVKDKDKAVESEKKSDSDKKADADKKVEGEKKEGDKKTEGDKKAESDKKDDKKDDKDKKDEKDKKDDRRESSRRRDRRDSHSDDERSGSPRRRSRGVELPPDPYLLLALFYFDTSRGGYINKKDLQNLFMSLGLQLSRSQIRSVLEKVCVKENFNYKTLIQAVKDLASGSIEAIQDLPLESTVSENDVPPQVAELEATIAAGNRELLPVFNRNKEGTDGSKGETKDVSDTGMVVYKGRVIDVGALVLAESKSASIRAKLEEALESARKALKLARNTAQATRQAEKGAQSKVADLAADLAAARARVTSLMASSKIFHSALKSIQAKVEAVVNIKFEDDDVMEVVNGPAKLQKDLKVEKKEKDSKQEVKDMEDLTEDDNSKADSKEDSETDGKEQSEAKEKESADTLSTEMDLDDKE